MTVVMWSQPAAHLNVLEVQGRRPEAAEQHKRRVGLAAPIDTTHRGRFSCAIFLGQADRTYTRVWSGLEGSRPTR